MIVPTPPPSVVSAPSSFRLQPLRRRYLESQTLQPPLSPSFQTVGPSRTRRKDRVQVSCGLPNRIKLRSSSRRSNYENDWPKAATPFPHDPDTNYLEKSPDSRPLAVSDTPCYLDAVKAEFRDRPDVYNRFLDIMQDFRSGAIDTPGAKQRVSILFDKSPRLFKGFDNFLSEGHRIDTPSVTALHNSPSEVPLSRGAAHSPKEQKDTSGAEPITPTQSIQQYHWTPITFIRHHNVYDHSTRHNEIDLSVNKSVDFSTMTYNQTWLPIPGLDPLPTGIHPTTASAELFTSPLHSLLTECRALLEDLRNPFSVIIEGQTEATSPSYQPPHAHYQGLHQALLAARGTVWELSKQLNEVLNRYSPFSDINKLSKQFEEDVRLEAIRILNNIRGVRLVLVGACHSAPYLRLETFVKLIEPYDEWREGVVALQSAIEVAERRLIDSCKAASGPSEPAGNGESMGDGRTPRIGWSMCKL